MIEELVRSKLNDAHKDLGDLKSLINYDGEVCRWGRGGGYNAGCTNKFVAYSGKNNIASGPYINEIRYSDSNKLHCGNVHTHNYNNYLEQINKFDLPHMSQRNKYTRSFSVEPRPVLPSKSFQSSFKRSLSCHQPRFYDLELSSSPIFHTTSYTSSNKFHPATENQSYTPKRAFDRYLIQPPKTFYNYQEDTCYSNTNKYKPHQHISNFVYPGKFFFHKPSPIHFLEYYSCSPPPHPKSNVESLNLITRALDNRGRISKICSPKTDARSLSASRAEELSPSWPPLFQSRQSLSQQQLYTPPQLSPSRSHKIIGSAVDEDSDDADFNLLKLTARRHHSTNYFPHHQSPYYPSVSSPKLRPPPPLITDSLHPLRKFSPYFRHAVIQPSLPEVSAPAYPPAVGAHHDTLHTTGDRFINIATSSDVNSNIGAADSYSLYTHTPSLHVGYDDDEELYPYTDHHHSQQSLKQSIQSIKQYQIAKHSTDNFNYYKQMFRRKQHTPSVNDARHTPHNTQNFLYSNYNQVSQPATIESQKSPPNYPSYNTRYDDGYFFDDSSRNLIISPPTRVTKPVTYLKRFGGTNEAVFVSKYDFQH
ncbi:hypothetical protein HELRODRAFT_190969 [Helobdella robusta]|uniref:Uncharacterized protein n=1 Tax=Helobdella robusta TaxID=6412 RepID=T1FSG8_HELRO|nr:hypothetical protein HELRODRAFT_190969 [Helobdella robusta]ESO07508.1 hypothetical protein HELRODRAFT_190969 [Helobdella robusta]